jgi:hypothetical protein
LRRLLLVWTILGVGALLEAFDARFKRVTPRLRWGRCRPAARSCAYRRAASRGLTSLAPAALGRLHHLLYQRTEHAGPALGGLRGSARHLTHLACLFAELAEHADDLTDGLRSGVIGVRVCRLRGAQLARVRVLLRLERGDVGRQLRGQRGQHGRDRRAHRVRARGKHWYLR